MALATVISLAVNILFSSLALRLYLKVPVFRGGTRQRMAEVLRQIIRIGIPSMWEPTSYQLYQVAVTALVVALGATALAARVYVHNLVLIIVISAIFVYFRWRQGVWKTTGVNH